MKKIITSAVVIIIGLVANAASFSWSIDNSYKPGTTAAAEGWVAVFFDNGDISRTDFITSLSNGSYISNINSFGGVANDLTDEDGYADGAAKRSNYGNPEQIDGYFVLFNSDDASTATLAYVSELSTSSTAPMAGSLGDFSFGNVTATQTASNWTAVPEPTSGLLLLLGVAGLALKRKRA